MPANAPQQGSAAGVPKRRLLSPADNPLVRAVGRLPAGVHVKLLVAFGGIALLVVVLGALGLRLLGQSNERVETLGTLQQRAFAYGKLQSDARHVRLLYAQNVGGDYYKVFPDLNKKDLAADGPATDRLIKSAVAQIPPSTYPDILGFRPPPEDEVFLKRIRTTGRKLSEMMREIVEVDAVAPKRATSLRYRAELLSIDLNQQATELANTTRKRTNALIAENASSLHELAKPLRRRGGGDDRPRAPTGVRALVVADRADPADRLPTGRDRLRELLGSCGRREPRRTRRTGGQRQPDERRAPTPLPRARDRQQTQVGVPGEHVARTAHAAERDHRVLAGAARRAVRRGQRQAGGVPRGHPDLGQPPAGAHQRRARPLQGRGGSGAAGARAVLDQRRPRARRLDGARTGDQERRPV